MGLDVWTIAVLLTVGQDQPAPRSLQERLGELEVRLASLERRAKALEGENRALEERSSLAAAAPKGPTAETAATANAVRNPEYERWSRSKPGSWVTFEQPCGKGAVMQETYKLLTLSEGAAVFECTKVENGFRYPLFERSVPGKLDARGLPGAQARSPEGGEIEFRGPGGKAKWLWRKVAEGDEEIDIAGRKLSCHWVTVACELDSLFETFREKSRTKTWYSTEIPGQVAKVEMTRRINDNPPVVVRVATGWQNQ
jgi:hypothetical protein